MPIINLQFLDDFRNCQSPQTQKLRICVELDNHETYILTVVTPDYLQSWMEANDRNYLPPSNLWMIVRQLTPQIIQETMEAYATESDGYLLKFFHYYPLFDANIMQQVETKYKADMEELEKQWEEEEKE